MVSSERGRKSPEKKKKFQPPKLVAYGSVHTLTRVANPSSNADNPGAPSQKMTRI